MVPGVHLREAACREIIGLSVSDQLERELVVTLVGQRELNGGPEIDYPNRVLLLPSFLFVFVILEFGCICLFVELENEEPLRPVLSTSGITAQIEHALRQMRYVIRGNTMLPLSAPVTRHHYQQLLEYLCIHTVTMVRILRMLRQCICV